MCSSIHENEYICYINCVHNVVPEKYKQIKENFYRNATGSEKNLLSRETYIDYVLRKQEFWYPNSQKALEINYGSQMIDKKCLLDGKQYSWYPNGQKGREEFYRNGFKDQEQYYWDQDGVLLQN